jgi:hypothetical protein
LRRIHVARQRPHDIAALRVAAEVEVRGHVGREGPAFSIGTSAWRIERHDVQAGSVDRPARSAVAQVADIGDGAAALE